MIWVQKFWKSIKRNPVINGFIAAVITQFAYDYAANRIDWTNILSYVGMVCIGVAVRGFVVPLREHEEEILKAKNVARFKSEGNLD